MQIIKNISVKYSSFVFAICKWFLLQHIRTNPSVLIFVVMDKIQSNLRTAMKNTGRCFAYYFYFRHFAAFASVLYCNFNIRYYLWLAFGVAAFNNGTGTRVLASKHRWSSSLRRSHPSCDETVDIFELAWKRCWIESMGSPVFTMKVLCSLFFVLT